MSLGRWTNEPALALKVLSPTMTCSSPSSTQKASSSRWWMWGGGPPPGGTTESVSEYAPPVSSPETLKVISSSTTQSILPSPSLMCIAPGWFASMPFSSLTHALFYVGRKTRSSQGCRLRSLKGLYLENAKGRVDSIHRAAESKVFSETQSPFLVILGKG